MKKYSFVDDYVNGFAAVSNKNKWGFINDKGEQICELIYDDLYAMVDGFAKVKLNTKYGIIDKNGVEIFKCKYNLSEINKIFFDYIKLKNQRKVKINNIYSMSKLLTLYLQKYLGDTTIERIIFNFLLDDFVNSHTDIIYISITIFNENEIELLIFPKNYDAYNITINRVPYIRKAKLLTLNINE